jgi:hypothetical protein
MVHVSNNMIAHSEKGVLEHGAATDLSEDLGPENDAAIARARRKYDSGFQVKKRSLTR